MEEIPVNIAKIVREREEYRKQKDWTMADELRKEINDMGWSITDKEDHFILEEK